MNTARAFDYNFEIPRLVLLCFGKGKKINVSNDIQPVRKVTVGDAIHKVDEANSCGRIFVAHFENNKVREIYVPYKNDTLSWDGSVFLKEGRNSNYFEEIEYGRLITRKEAVSPVLKNEMETAFQKFNEAITNEPTQLIHMRVGRSVSSGGTDPTGGQFFSIQYLEDDTEREIYVPVDAGRLIWTEATFLQEYDPKEWAHMHNFYSLRLKNPENIKDVVIPSFVDKMKSVLEDHNKGIRATALARLSKRQLTP
ncbi:MAG: hypothetical protein PHD48_05520 [Alphaproteobacteria bacterium]|nr:hypothetical protein [Alphaproteobacteria bacterium]